MTSAIYIRVSTEEQATSGVSLAAQEKSCREYAMKKGFTVSAVYRDEGITSTIPLAERPAGRELTEQVLSGRVQHVISHSLSRMFRNDFEAIGVATAWEKLDVKMHILDMGGAIDRSTPGGELIYNILATVASVERKQIAARVKTAMRHIASTGRKPSGDIYGYDRDENGALAINPTEAAIVKEIYERSLAGEQKQAIARDLNARKIPLKRHATQWRDTMVNKILHNPIYMGQFRHGGELWPGSHTPIIDNGDWKRMQEQFLTYLRYSPTGRRPGTYSGLFRCGVCGGRVVRSTSRNRSGVYYYYRCHDRFSASTRHAGVSCAEGVLQDLIWGDVRRLLADLKLGPSIEAAQSKNSAISLEKTPTMRLSEIETSLEELTIARLRNARAYQAGAITLDDLMLLNDPLMQQENKLNRERVKLADDVSSGEFLPEVDNIDDLIMGLREDCTIPEQLDFLRRLYGKFELFSTHIVAHTIHLTSPYKLIIPPKGRKIALK